MTIDYIHKHKNFQDLILIIANEMSISPILIEKDYWIMHCLYGLQQQGFEFQMKGGTSLSKGFKLINRFSEDIDILIVPPDHMDVYVGRNQDKQSHRLSRLSYYNWLAENICIDGIQKIERDAVFDDEKYRSGGIRLFYKSTYHNLRDIKEGVLLEVGFDDVVPNIPKTISSWVYDYAVDKVDIVDNRAQNIPCYHPGYTFVEKLQTISTKFRKQQNEGFFSENFMRHYYDVYCLLSDPETHMFIGTDEYLDHKNKRFRGGDNPIISQNEAFLLTDSRVRAMYEQEYNLSRSLYYLEKPSFSDILDLIHRNIVVL